MKMSKTNQMLTLNLHSPLCKTECSNNKKSLLWYNNLFLLNVLSIFVNYLIKNCIWKQSYYRIQQIRTLFTVLGMHWFPNNRLNCKTNLQCTSYLFCARDIRFWFMKCRYFWIIQLILEIILFLRLIFIMQTIGNPDLKSIRRTFDPFPGWIHDGADWMVGWVGWRCLMIGWLVGWWCDDGMMGWLVERFGRSWFFTARLVATIGNTHYEISKYAVLRKIVLLNLINIKK